MIQNYVTSVLGIMLVSILVYSAIVIKESTLEAFRSYVVAHHYKWRTLTSYTVIGLVLSITSIIGIGYVMSWQPPPPIKLIILDIDGVLNHNKAPMHTDTNHHDPECVIRLNKLIKIHQAKIVACSAWRICQTMGSMQKTLNSIGVRGEVVGLTPILRGCHTRDDEITVWLSNFGGFHKVKAIVVLDDVTSERFKDIQVRPSWKLGGLLDDHVEEADKILSAGLPENFDIGKVEVCESKVNKEINFGGHSIQKKQSGL